MKSVTYFVVTLAALSSALIAIKSASAPFSASILPFIVWTISPYAYLGLITALVSSNAAKTATFLFALLLGTTGVFIIMDAICINKDAQNGLVFIFIPGWQWVFLLAISIPVYFLNKLKQT